ncbi:MAG: hypothetical protein ACO1OQ_05975 [Rufibacter sp.]
MKTYLFPLASLLVASLVVTACSHSASEAQQETDATTAATAADSTATAPAKPEEVKPEPAASRPADPKLQAMINLFPELKLPYTITLTGDTFDKAEGKKQIKPALEEARDYLGFEFAEDGYKNSFIGITPLGRIRTEGGTLLLYVSEWDGSCPTLSTTFLPNDGGPRVQDLEQITCGPCRVTTGTIAFTREVITKKLTSENDCAEGEPVRGSSETVYTIKKDGIEETKSTTN